MSKTRMIAVLGALIVASLISHPRTGSATPVPGALAIGKAIPSNFEAARWRGHGGRGWRGGWGGFGAGLAVSAIVGGLLAAPYYRRPYYYDDPGIDYCIRRFRSYDPYRRIQGTTDIDIRALEPFETEKLLCRNRKRQGASPMTPGNMRSNPTLRLIRASKSRPSGTWSDDDYDVFDGERRLLAEFKAS